jgi:hypothetical protein
MNVEGISLAGGKVGCALSRGTDSVIVLRGLRGEGGVKEDGW